MRKHRETQAEKDAHHAFLVRSHMAWRLSFEARNKPLVKAAQAASAALHGPTILAAAIAKRERKQALRLAA